MKSLMFAALLALSAGCTTYVHKRPVHAADGKLIGYESTTVRAMAAKLSADTLRSTTESSSLPGTVYTRRVGVENGSASPDAAAINALSGAAQQLAEKAFEIGLQAGKMSGGIP